MANCLAISLTWTLPGPHTAGYALPVGFPVLRILGRQSLVADDHHILRVLLLSGLCEGRVGHRRGLR
jgi:hypothetical protein